MAKNLMWLGIKKEYELTLPICKEPEKIEGSSVKVSIPSFLQDFEGKKPNKELSKDDLLDILFDFSRKELLNISYIDFNGLNPV